MVSTDLDLLVQIQTELSFHCYIWLQTAVYVIYIGLHPQISFIPYTNSTNHIINHTPDPHFQNKNEDFLHFADVKCVRWRSSPSRTCRYTPSLTRKQSHTSALTAPSPSPTRPTCRSTCAFTWEWSRITAPTARNPSASSPTYSSTPGTSSASVIFEF